ncbi:MAG: DUF971 domain-containing protein [Chloroflexota bacterium]|nr:DUF971 domain-containing protein [Chloroflexota bacterium]
MSDNTAQHQSLVPHSVVAEESTNRLIIAWSDGTETSYPIEWLRWQCPCALCRGEMGVPGRLAYTKTLTADETRLEDVQSIGRYAIMIFWGDGHHDGMYTYNWLRENSQDALPETAPAAEKPK